MYIYESVYIIILRMHNIIQYSIYSIAIIFLCTSISNCISTSLFSTCWWSLLPGHSPLYSLVRPIHPAAWWYPFLFYIQVYTSACTRSIIIILYYQILDFGPYGQSWGAMYIFHFSCLFSFLCFLCLPCMGGVKGLLGTFPRCVHIRR